VFFRWFVFCFFYLFVCMFFWGWGIFLFCHIRFEEGFWKLDSMKIKCWSWVKISVSVSAYALYYLYLRYRLSISATSAYQKYWLQYWLILTLSGTLKPIRYCRYILESADFWNHGLGFLETEVGDDRIIPSSVSSPIVNHHTSNYTLYILNHDSLWLYSYPN